MGASKPPKHEFSRVLVVSTAHITLRDSESLETITHEPESLVAANGYGWLIWTWNTDRQARDNYPSMSTAFYRLLSHARKLNCQWVRLDRDGPEESNLATFDW